MEEAVPRSRKTRKSRGNLTLSEHQIRRNRKLDRLRKLIVAGRTTPDFFSWPPHSTSPIGLVICNFNRLYFRPYAQERAVDSVQEDLLESLKTMGVGDNLKQYEEAQASARGVLFDCAVSMTFLHGYEAVGSDTEAIAMVALLEEPFLLISDENLATFLAETIATAVEKNEPGESDNVSEARAIRSARAVKFLQFFTDQIYNASRRDQIVPVDLHAYVLARHWTDSHCPLWLMETKAIVKACKGLSRKGQWTETKVNDLLKKTKLRRHDHHPIVDVVLHKEKFIIEFKISKGGSRHLKCAEYTWSFLPHPKSQSQPSLKEIMTTPGPWTLGEVFKRQAELAIEEPKFVRPPGYKVVPRKDVRQRVDK